MPMAMSSRAISGSGWISAKRALEGGLRHWLLCHVRALNENFAEIGTADTLASCKLYTAVA